MGIVNNMKTKILKILAILIAITVIIWIVTKPSEKEKQFKTSQLFKEEFVAGCIDSDPGLKSFCNCTYTQIETKLGLEGVQALVVKYDATGVLPDGVMDIANSCSSFIE